ncbi:MAG: MATE family efflux transporter [Saprospiraceae bacterium]
MNTSYKTILHISTPIMLGSAVQNIIALSDGVFLFHLDELDFAAIGFVGVFYLVIAAIGFGFSKGGQIMIARRIGEGKSEEVGRTFYAMVYFEFALAIVMFLFMTFGCQWFFSEFVDPSSPIYTKSLAYLDYRSYGVFFSYIGVAIVALYTGTARTYFIVVDTLILAVVNIALNYSLIFGHWGFPEMGIAGAGLASTIAEMVAFIVFVLYMIFDTPLRKYRLNRIPNIDLTLIKQQLNISAPIVAQAVVGLGSWFVFFGIVENLGGRALAITNLVRMVYLFLSIPCWGFASGINTIVSNLIGQRKRMAVLPMIWKTAKVCWLTTMVLTLPVVLFPEHILYPILGSEEMSIITEARPIFYVLLGILSLFSVGGVYFNGLAGTGATYFGLKMQAICAVGYLSYIYIVVEYTDGGLVWAWASEIFYWIAMLCFTVYYLRSKAWHFLKV